ncbi:LysR family transcriptional regulator [Labrenzia sp. PHM005]|uniref:LysR family transcriptional regulator n=1 Tax=Labrenzia sp. PHM005 TaxID=2590016 RepID=UPI001FFCE777|nr:LysR family transcriptional regulator [Labrenzia sp. PHM005]
MPVAPPRPKMPPLNALRAFEAAARLNSFAAAADELCVTPAAVAQQIKSLEEWTGKKLFKRHAKGVHLTPLGANVLPGFMAAFDAMAASVQTLRSLANPQDIRIAATPSIAQLWISPRLPSLRTALPQMSVSITAMEAPPNLAREPFDLAIFFRPQDYIENDIIAAPDIIFPVCAPEVAQDLKAPGSLTAQTLLFDTTWKSDWETWLDKAAPGQNLLKSGPEYSLYSLALEECKNGAGILIGHETLVRPLLESGQLVAPFQTEVTLPSALTIRSMKPFQDGSPLKQVTDFLVALTL